MVKNNAYTSVILTAIFIVGIVGILSFIKFGTTGLATIPARYPSDTPITPLPPIAPYTNAPPGGQEVPPPVVLPNDILDEINSGVDFVEFPVTLELSRIFWIDYVGDVHATPLGTDCGPDSSAFKKIRKGIGWRTFPVAYQIDTSDSAASQAVTNGFNSWDAEEHIAGGFFTQATPHKILVGWTGLDGSGGALAVTSITYNIRTGEIVHATITYDSGDSWAVFPTLSCTSQGGAFDIENVGTHEVGHAIGLDHVRRATDVGLTMYPFASQGETFKRTLGTGDKKGIDSLY